jgi:hypothetical protein
VAGGYIPQRADGRYVEAVLLAQYADLEISWISIVAPPDPQREAAPRLDPPPDVDVEM